MPNHNSALQREETPHSRISDALKRRAQSLLQDKSIDATARAFIRYGLETNDAWLYELVRRADAGEPLSDLSVLQTLAISTDEKVELLAKILCRGGDDPTSKSAALLVLMATLEGSTQPKVLANHVKHLAFTRCNELNCFGLVDAQIAALEDQLLAANTLIN